MKNKLLNLLNAPAQRHCVKYCYRRRKTGKAAGIIEHWMFVVVSALEYRTRPKPINGGYSYFDAPNG